MTNSKDIYLIWGTFAKDADWVQDDSEFRQQLNAELTRENINPNYIIHDWSGENSHKARTEAAERLAELTIENEAVKSSSEKPVYVGHSHGGSVALQAAEILSKKEILPNVITLGTPFLIAKKRQVPLFELVLFISIFVYTYFMLSGTLDFWLIFYTLDALDKYIFVSALLGVFVVFLWRKLASINENMVLRYGLARNSGGVEAYSLYTVADETRLVLKVSVLFTFLVQLLWWLVIVAMPYFLITVAGSTLVTAMLIGESNELCSAADLLEFLGLNDGVIQVVVFSLIVFSVLVGLLRGSWMAFGGENPLWHLTHYLKVSILGNSNSESKLVVYQTNRSLRHSGFYVNKKCIEIIASKVAKWKINRSIFRWNLTNLLRYGVLVLIVSYVNIQILLNVNEQILMYGGACAGG